MKAAAKVVLGAASGALLVSSAGADQPKRLTAQSFYDRAVVVEMVLIDAIRSNKPRRLLTLYDALLDEYDVTWGRAAEADGRVCARLISALAVVAATVHDHVEQRTEPSSMANSAWVNYRRDLAQCEKQPGVVVFDRKLPEKLSEVF
ncbi:hypothetical protein EZH22_06465 [Xanthobacter dioxanivorans]|uniref:Uncharacterized protein n=1 Tax=Xanthobacter dioxanivorans TaxID=2528964 RepID=A0A974SJP4_9HYPH|nr:hypothetical protein [Xanthobacter dioxanivorans]QRG07990.1 hypothetical protein EZH22_06465 [Xanthobacter dioxanivorans]